LIIDCAPIEIERIYFKRRPHTAPTTTNDKPLKKAYLQYGIQR